MGKYGIEEGILEGYVGPFVNNPNFRRDFTRILKTISARYTLEAATKFGEFYKTVLIA